MVENREPSDLRNSSGGILGMLGLATGLAAIWLAIWWLNLPSLESLKTTQSFRDVFFTTPWAALPAVGLGLVGLLVAAQIPQLRVNLKPAWLNIIPPISALILAGVMSWSVPAIYRQAAYIRSEVEAAERSMKQLQSLSELELKTALARAENEKNQQLLDATKKSKQSIEEAKAKAEGEIKKIQEKAAGDIAAAEQKGATAIALLQKEQEERRKLEANMGAMVTSPGNSSPTTEPAPGSTTPSTQPSPLAAPPGPATPGSKASDPSTEALVNVLKMGIGLAVMVYAPELAPLVAAILGTEFGTDYKTMNEAGSVLQASFPGGKFDAAAAKQAYDLLYAKNLDDQQMNKIRKAFDKIGAIPAKGPTHEEFQKFRDFLEKYQTPDVPKLVEELVLKVFDKKVPDAKKATAAMLLEVYGELKETLPGEAFSRSKAIELVLKIAEFRVVPEVIRKEAERLLKDENR